MYYDPTWPGDPDYLEDKFVSFSYRFKFNDGEYSITAPFTQEAFIPKFLFRLQLILFRGNLISHQ